MSYREQEMIFDEIESAFKRGYNKALQDARNVAVEKGSSALVEWLSKNGESKA